MPDRDREEQKSKVEGSGAVRAMALMFDLGFRLAAPIVVGVLAGAALDGALKTTPWLLIVGVLAGVGVAFYAMYDVARTYGSRTR